MDVSSMTATGARTDIVIEIGGLPIRIISTDSCFLQQLGKRYAGFAKTSCDSRFEFEMDLMQPGSFASDEDVQVNLEGGQWQMRRGDLRANWDPVFARGRIRQTANPYSIDSVLRIVHTLLLAKEGGFLMHASSAIRNGRAFLFAGISGAGKTTIARLAPPDTSLLTDEISYVTRQDKDYFAFGTPFTGELGRAGENLHAPIAAVYLLAKGTENEITPVEPAAAVRALLENILFFAKDAELVKSVFEAACDFIRRVPVMRLTFVPDQRVWELIQ
jgi:hypothetical protein